MTECPKCGEEAIRSSDVKSRGFTMYIHSEKEVQVGLLPPMNMIDDSCMVDTCFGCGAMGTMVNEDDGRRCSSCDWSPDE